MNKTLQALGVTAAILLAIWAVETLLDKVRPRTPAWARIMLMLGVGILVFMIAVKAAGAHDNPTDWIGQERRTNAAGVLCCGKGDCTPFTVEQVKVMPDGYHFPDGDIVPFDKTAPSVDHFYYKCVWGGERKCTFAPMGAS